MNARMKRLGAALLLVLAPAAAAVAIGPTPTSHAVARAEIGAPMAGRAFEAIVDEPGPVEVETVVGAEWRVPLSGLVNLEHPAAKAAGLADRDEPIVVAFHALRHPTRGTFLVDTGVERALFDAPDEAAIRGVVARVARIDAMTRRTDTATWLARHPDARVGGVLLTHLHLDHVSGMRDVPDATPVFVGPGEATARSAENLAVRGSVDRALEGKPALSELAFTPDPDGLFAGVLDLFGDRSVFAVHVPGHTKGSVAYVARTPSGPVLFTGDACHTAWGWEHGVEPGSFSADKPRSAESLATLRAFAARHPRLVVRLGHQPRGRRPPRST